MARAHKYTSINFNDIFENPKSNKPSNQSPSSSSSSSSTTRSHSHGGGMLVLTRPQPKPLQPIPQQQPISTPNQPPFEPASSIPSSTPPPSKPDTFVPPHLRPGFVGKDERFGQKQQHHQLGFRSREQGQSGSGEDGRPTSGAGYDRIRRSGVESDVGGGEMNRPRSGGWYGNGSSFRSSPNY
ncbi:hypothetical protein GIB67_015620 [Kingdonia uniflora]|uniref:Uncharacterized protein n=1 Tax=Kingdonia uniflora TaxID=39325 RepID=A0A7J7NUT4_9MAGN|nr:hypothetical protein GIB67_015620 [Kingdonia uniflora]